MSKTEFLATLITILFLGFLFFIAYSTERKKFSFISRFLNMPTFYALSFSVYCTDWTFYGSIGRSYATLLGFLPVYLGPTVMATGFFNLLAKTIRICKTYNLNTIADFISARYGKSAIVGGIVSIMLMLGVLPYISLQLKGIHKSFEIISGQNTTSSLTAFLITLILVAFSIIFGTRKLDASEKHEGLLVSVVFAGLLKLSAFLALGVFTVWFLFDGHGDLMDRALETEHIINLMQLKKIRETEWLTVFLLSMFAIILLPHMFQVAVVENRSEAHVKKAVWGFPLYLFLINLFVIPIMFAGVVIFGIEADSDAFALKIPMHAENTILSLFVYVGGLSAAIGMAFMAVVALSTMVSNNLILPLLLNFHMLKADGTQELAPLILRIRRITIGILFLIAFGYYQTVGKYFTLVSIGLVSFAAVFQLVPSFIGALYWRQGNRNGAIAGLISGFAVWAYTLPFPQMITSGIFPQSIRDFGPFGIAMLKPEALFGLTGYDVLSNSVFWSLLFNAGSYIVVSLFTESRQIEKTQAVSFVDVFKESTKSSNLAWSGQAAFSEVKGILVRFLGEKQTDKILLEYENQASIELKEDSVADADFLKYAESVLSGSIGATSARSVLSMVVQESSAVNMQEMLDILDESKKVREFSEELKQLKQKQDGDYYLTSLLLRPLSMNEMELDYVVSDYLLKQHKEFEFRKWKSELGGDLCITSSFQLMDLNYGFFMNADAMGKSMQGAGGAIVMGSVIRSIIERTKNEEEAANVYPEIWLKKCFVEAQRIFETFQGTMVISLIMGLIEERTGTVFYIIAEHPRVILYRQGKAEFLQENAMLMKLGISGLSSKIQLNTFQLKKNDMLFIGSDGKDDIDLNRSEDDRKRLLNEDETMILSIVQKAEGNLDKIHEELLAFGSLTDDLSIIRIQYLGDGLEETVSVEPEVKQLVKDAEESYKQDDAREALLAIRKIPTHVELPAGLVARIAKLLILIKEPDIALQFLHSCYLTHPTNAELLYLISIAYKKINDLEESVQFGERLLLLDPSHIKNRIQMYKNYVILGNDRRANKILSDLSKAYPENELVKRLVQRKVNTDATSFFK